MLLTDGLGTPLKVTAHSASHHEVRLIKPLLEKHLCFHTKPKRLIYDKAADAGWLRRSFQRLNIRLIAPFRKRKKQPKPKPFPQRDQNFFKNRWRVERTIGWLKNFRRLQTRYDYYASHFLGFWTLGNLFTILRGL
jgi:transposase